MTVTTTATDTTTDTADPETEVLITGDAARLPVAYAEYINPYKPLPAEVVFFEKSVTFEGMVKAFLVSSGLGFLGAISVIMAISILFDRSTPGRPQTSNFGLLSFGATCLFAAWMMMQTLKVRWTVMRKQQRGEPTRVGIFLTPNTLFEATEWDYIIIPRSEFLGLGGAGKRTVQYRFKGQDKQIRLPHSLVRNNPAELLSAIERWSRAAVSSGE